MPQRALPLLKRFGPAALVAVAVVVALASGVARHLSVHELRERRELIMAMDHIHPILSVLAYVGLYTLVIALSLPAALPMTVAGGLFFGPWIGGRRSAARWAARSSIWSAAPPPATCCAAPPAPEWPRSRTACAATPSSTS